MALKRFSTLIGIAALLSTLVACGDGGSGSSNNSADTTAYESHNGVAAASGLFTVAGIIPPVTSAPVTVNASLSTITIPASTTFTVAGLPVTPVTPGGIANLQPTNYMFTATATYLLGTLPPGSPGPFPPGIVDSSVQLKVTVPSLPTAVVNAIVPSAPPVAPVTISERTATASPTASLYVLASWGWTPDTTFIPVVGGRVTFSTANVPFNAGTATFAIVTP